MVIVNIVVFVLVLSLLVLVHEFGHFFFARKADILCHEFAIGMGPVVYQKRDGEIVYSIRALPLGGYVAMAGEEMSDAYIKEGQTIGIRLNDDNVITDIVLNEGNQYDKRGIVKDFDLYGADMKDLHITLEVDGVLETYAVLRDAKYRFKEDKPMWITPSERSFETKTKWERFKVIFAGPLFNFILAFFLLFGVGIFMGAPNKDAVVGKTEAGINLQEGDVITSVDGNNVEKFDDIAKYIRAAQNNKVTVTVDGSTQTLDLLVIIQGLGFSSTYKEDDLIVGNVFGRNKDLKKGDEIRGILLTNAVTTAPSYERFTTWTDLIDYVTTNSEKEQVYIEYLRNGSDLKEDNYTAISGNALEKLGSSSVAYSAGFEQARKFSLLFPLYYPFQQIGSDVSEMFATLGLLFNPGEQVGVGDLSGPVGIYSLVSQAFEQGFMNFVIFVAFLSVNIGLINLLPIPALDGGRLAFLGYEAITGRKVNKKVESMLINITFLLLIGLLIYVTFNDITRLFN